MKFELYGRIPSKKNHHHAMCIKGHGVIFLSGEYKKWEKEQLKVLVEIKNTLKIETIKKCSISMTFYFPDKRKTDTRNKAEGIFDILAASGIIEDDNSNVVDNEHYYFGGIDKENPRVEIEITELKQ